MPPLDTVSGLTAFTERGAGTDAERRAALWAAAELRRAGRQVHVESFWCRPNWALANAWHVGLGLAGSLVAVHAPRVGAALLLAALLSVILDALFALSPGRLLSPERASQNVVALPPPATRNRPVSLILTANIDAGRAGLAFRDSMRRPVARVRTALGGFTPGWLGWLAILLVWLLAVAVARFEGGGGSALGVAQLVPTITLVFYLAALLDLAGAAYAPAANDDASGVAAALEIARRLDAEPLDHAAVHVVLTGAGDVSGFGLRRYLRSRRRSMQAHNTVVIGLAACGRGQPRWWRSDGQLLPLVFFDRLRGLCRELAEDDASALAPSGHRGRGATPALPARAAGIPAISLGSLDELGLAPASHQQSDTAQSIDGGALEHTITTGLLLADSIDVFLAERQ